MSDLKGSCMCGQISYDSNAEPVMTAISHCLDSQKQTGTSFSIVVGVPESELQVEGKPKIFSTTGTSGQAVNRHFCGSCGSPIYSQADMLPGLLLVIAGTLDDTSWLSPELEIWCDSRQKWLQLDGTWDKTPGNPQLS